MPYKYNFADIAENVDVTAVARLRNLELKPSGNSLRANCPRCKSDDPRSLEIIPETNSFRCHAAEPPPGKEVLGGDCIALYAHLMGYDGMYRAAKELHERFLAEPQRATPPAPAPAPATKKKEHANFDPQKFLAKLVYNERVAELGWSEEDATYYGVGYHPKYEKVYFAIRDPATGDIAGFMDERLKIPSTWVRPANVVPLRRPA